MGDVEVLIKPFSAVQILSHLARGYAAKQRAVQFFELRTNVLDYQAKSGDFDKAAETVLKNISQLGNRGLEVLYELYEKAGRFNEALSVVDGLLAKNETNIALLNAKGRLLMRLGKLDQAKACLEKADAVAPLQIERIAEMAALYLKLNQPDSSVTKFKELLKLNPDKPEMKFDMFQQLIDSGFDQHACQFCRETTRPIEVVRHYNNKGVLASKNGEAENAIIAYQQALGFFPDFKENYRILFNLALAYAHRNTPESRAAAITHLRRCLELAPEFDKAKNALQVLMGGKG